MTRTIVTLALGLTIGALAPTSAVADQAAPRPAENLWDLWAGCWTLTDETTDDGSATIARLLGLPAPKTKGPGAGQGLCHNRRRPDRNPGDNAWRSTGTD
jgi:hypothetical protein